ncbi:hypothetical protein BDA99DRAFT_530100 [Phascolomyces articulosus]|uniref:Uncharacterized protein n=1 Tax=Phascolomyces articulosus TaxID=60185 RepID=A0AAD5P6S8_9FUNG|nr:hypothetical protein BDA99DRAFT_530100 [Phascolomyces articulosus]
MLDDCCLILIIMLLPPVGVFLLKGCGADFWINLCLTILGYIPGHLHGFYVMIKEREHAQYVAQHYSTPNPSTAYYGTVHPPTQAQAPPPPTGSTPYQPGPRATTVGASNSPPVSYQTAPPPKYEPPAPNVASTIPRPPSPKKN